jgi:hypothetical protein
MSERIGLRTRIEDAIIVHTERCDCCPLVDKPQKLAGAVLRVLAEHGDTQQVREQIADALTGAERFRFDLIMTVVAPIVAERDAANEQLERYDGQAWEDLQADLAAARQQLDRAEAIVELVRKVGRGTVTPAELMALLDAHARPAGHDESGQ